MVRPISIFISHVQEDQSHLDDLKKSLVPYERKRIITVRTHNDISPGEERDKSIQAKIKESDIILFLVSIDFIASDQIYNVDRKTVSENNKSPLIAVIIRAVGLGQLDDIRFHKFFPSNKDPISNWKTKDDYWVNVVNSLEVVFNELNESNNDSLTKINSSESVKTSIKFSFSNALKLVNLTDKLVLSFIILLMCISLGILIYGFKNESWFYIFISIALAGLSLFGYFFGRRSLTA